MFSLKNLFKTKDTRTAIEKIYTSEKTISDTEESESFYLVHPSDRESRCEGIKSESTGASWTVEGLYGSYTHEEGFHTVALNDDYLRKCDPEDMPTGRVMRLTEDDLCRITKKLKNESSSTNKNSSLCMDIIGGGPRVTPGIVSLLPFGK